MPYTLPTLLRFPFTTSKLHILFLFKNRKKKPTIKSEKSKCMYA